MLKNPSIGLTTIVGTAITILGAIAVIANAVADLAPGTEVAGAALAIAGFLGVAVSRTAQALQIYKALNAPEAVDND